jgi:hypothetical protein
MGKFMSAMIFATITNVAVAQTVDAQDIEPMLQQMQASGRITKQQAEITRRYMKTMKPSDWQKIQNKAEKAIERNPAAAEKIATDGVGAVDMNEFNFQD